MTQAWFFVMHGAGWLAPTAGRPELNSELCVGRGALLFGGLRGCVCPARMMHGSGAVCMPPAQRRTSMHQAAEEVASGLFAVSDWLVWPKGLGLRLLCLALPCLALGCTATPTHGFACER